MSDPDLRVPELQPEPPAPEHRPAGGRAGLILRTRAALGLAPATAPALLFVPLGAVLGPQGLDVLSGAVLQHLDSVTSVALAALGIFVGMALDLRTPPARRAFAIGSGEALVTVAVVSVTIYVLVVTWRIPLDAPAVVVALVLGVSAAASSVSSAGEAPSGRLSAAARIADLDDVLPIVLGGAVIAAVGEPGLARVAWGTAATGLAGLTVGVAGWLLFERAHNAAERGVFVIGTVVLLGGSVAYVSLSPLLAGLVAGLFWTYSPGRADQIIRSDLQKIQHPLVVLLLLVAGATLQWSVAAVWLFAPYVVFRLMGKLAGAYAVARAEPTIPPAALAIYLIPPGVLGIAFALNFLQVSPTPTGNAVVWAAAIGSLTCEILALIAYAPPEPA